jgi:hypothetical protein
LAKSKTACGVEFDRDIALIVGGVSDWQNCLRYGADSVITKYVVKELRFRLSSIDPLVCQKSQIIIRRHQSEVIFDAVLAIYYDDPHNLTSFPILDHFLSYTSASIAVSKMTVQRTSINSLPNEVSFLQ